jgi:flagellar biosynthesis/type III secretory pathway protein FliH
MKTKEEIEQLAEQRFPINQDSRNSLLVDSGRQRGFEEGYTQCQEDMVKDVGVTNVEIIHQHGSRYRRNNCKVELSYHDDGKTLRVIVSSLNKQD